jgi:Domain of unknown function (DUF4375)
VPVRFRKLIPLKPTPSARRECARLIRAVIASPPDARKSDQARRDLEHLLMRLLVGSGIPAVESAIQSTSIGWLKTLVQEPGTHVWSGRDDKAHADLRISLTEDGFMKSTWVSWRAVPPPPGPPKGLTQKLQAQFYDRYVAVGKVAYADPPGRLSRTDKLLLTIGEFEADVNNGGFSQFLFNKGRRRALATVTALKKIGAPKTAAMLASALAHPKDETRLGKLDDRFYKVPEDLAVRTMKSLGVT